MGQPLGVATLDGKGKVLANQLPSFVDDVLEFEDKSVFPDVGESGKIYVDATLGGGGHSELILKKIQPEGRLISFDVDDDAIKFATKRLEKYPNITIVKGSYTDIDIHLKNLGIEK